MIEKTEKEIMKNWQGDISEPVVSICCITYNHEQYISEAINSFLMQETNFPFEIVIGEDCSTDNTRKIVEKYKEMYPNIIKLIVSENNVGMQANLQRTMEACIGEYMALCEGDDYWTDPRKLQIQIEEMQKYPEVDMSFHPAYELIDGKQGNILAKHADKNKIFTTSEVILGDGGFMPTNSLVFKKIMIDRLPQWFYDEAPVGDYFIQIYSALYKGVLFIPYIMSIYRKGHSGSWTDSVKKSKEKIIFVEKLKKALRYLNKDLDYKYRTEINRVINNYLWGIILSKNINISDKKVFFNNNKPSYSIIQKFMWYIIFSNPNIDKILRFFYDKVRGR